MLRLMFHEPIRQNEGRMKRIFDLADELSQMYANNVRGERFRRTQRMFAWTKSLVTSFDELEQSVYSAECFADKVVHEYVEDMSPEEEADYRRHLYFYKNGFIRVFSVLDKLGSFINERYHLETERFKERYSYFTVLRCMRDTGKHLDLYYKLNEVKIRYREPIHDLRLMRNHEIHALNSELLDDDGKIRLHPKDKKEKIEDLKWNANVLRSGYDMVEESLVFVFQYCKKC